MIDINIWQTITGLGTKMLFNKVKPDSTLVEEALSFNASSLSSLTTEKLRQYIVVLGQYLLTVQFTENQLEAIYNAWSKSLDNHIYKLLREGLVVNGELRKVEGSTVAAKKAWIVSEDSQASSMYNEVIQAEAKKTIVKGMSRPVEQYINTLKKELEARNNEMKGN